MARHGGRNASGVRPGTSPTEGRSPLLTLINGRFLMALDSANTVGSASSSKPADGASREAFDGTKDALVEGVHHLTDEVKATAGDAADQAKKAAESKLDAGRDFAAEHIGSVADALRKTEDELRSSDSALTEYVGQAASTLDHVSSYLQTRTLSQLMGDLEGYARREPAMFLGGSFVAGLLGGRFLKSATPAKAKPRTTSGASAPSYGALPASASQGAGPAAANVKSPTTAAAPATFAGSAGTKTSDDRGATPATTAGAASASTPESKSQTPGNNGGAYKSPAAGTGTR
jgi:hypothetical protein